MATNENIPQWKLELNKTISQYAPQERSTPAVEQRNQGKSLEQQLEDQLDGMIRQDLERRNIPSSKNTWSTDVERYAADQASAEVSPDPDREISIFEQLRYGFAEGSEQTMLQNAKNYIMTAHPETALMMGMRRQGVDREEHEEADIPVVPDFLEDALKAWGKSTANQLVRWFGTEQQVNAWENQQMEEQFGKGWPEMTPEQRRAAIEQDTNKKLQENFPDVYGTTAAEGGTAMVGQFAGMLADPTTLLPAGQTWKAAMAIGAGVGTSDAALWGLAKEGKIDPTHLALGTGLGAFAGPTINFIGGKTARFVTKKKNVREANKFLNKYENSVLRAMKRGSSKSLAHNMARVEWGVSNDLVTELYKVTNRVFKEPKTAAAARQAVEERAGWLYKNRTLARVGRGVDKIITPVTTRVARSTPRIAHNLRAHDAAVHLRTHIWFERVNPFIDKLKKMSKHDQVQIKRALVKQDNASLVKLVRQYENENPNKFKGFMNDVKEMRRTLREVGKTYKNMGYEFEWVENYFPRVWKDPNAEAHVQKGYLEQLVHSESKRLGRSLKEKEIQDLIRQALQKPKEEQVVARTGSSLRSRTVEEVNDALANFYADPMETLHSYLRAAAHDIERAKFFKKFGYKGKFLTDGTDMKKRLDEVVLAEKKRLGLDIDEVSDLTEMLRIRFNQGEMSPNRFIQGMKNVGYTTTLGNPISALTQISDQTFAMYKAGIHRTAREALNGILRKRNITKQDLGLTDAIEELYANTSTTKTTLNLSLKLSGFNMLDKFGKENIMNAALRKYQKLVRNQAGRDKFAAKWGEYFEGETAKLMSDLRNGRMTDNVKLLMWHELADVQPISLSEMPEMYLKHPGGRVFYMLKTFTIKQIDFMRRNILREFANGHYIRGTKNLAVFSGYWLLANGTADGLKATVTGADFDISDAMVENTLQLFAWSRYMGYQTMREGPWDAAIQFLAPPMNLINNVFLGIARGDYPKALEPVPLVGKLIYKADRAKKERIKKLYGSRAGQ